MSSSRFGAPASPWTERFGVVGGRVYGLTKKKDELLHAGLAPSNPRLHPQYYDFIPSADQFSIPVNDEEIDDILVAEEYQRYLLSGNQSWRIPPLNSVLSWDGSAILLGGHQPGDDQLYPQLLRDYMAQRIEVDESTWLPFFAKDRWYNFDQDFSDTITEADGKTWENSAWDVDDDRIWNVLRFSIEIANRIVTTLIRDNNKWLGTILYGRVQLWYELYSKPADYQRYIGKKDYRILMNPDTEKDFCRRLGKLFLGRDVEPNADKRHEHITGLLKCLVWSFLPSTNPLLGVTAPYENGTAAHPMCMINPSLLVLLCGGTISIAERCILHVRQAIVYLDITREDELGHALFKARLQDGGNLSPAVQKQVSEDHEDHWLEPYVDSEPIREMGRSLEAAIFGGTPQFRPWLPKGKHAPGISLLATIMRYPNLDAMPHLDRDLDGNHPQLKPGAPDELSLIPAALFWRLQSKDFWHPIPPRGQNGFIFPPLFTTTVSKERYTNRSLFRPIIVNPDAASGITFRDMAHKWNERLSIWSARRPWHDEALKTWLKTPWGYSRMRTRIHLFMGAYQARDETACANMAWELERAIPQTSFENARRNVATWIPQEGSTTGSPPLWLFHCLGLLMLAALPLRKVDSIPDPWYVTVTIRRSQAVGNQFPDTITSRWPPRQQPQRISRRNRYFSRLSKDNNVVNIPTRERFVAEVISMMLYFGRTRGIHVHKPFYIALRRLASYIRTRIRSKGFSQSSWLPRFPFEMPAYQPSTFVKWSTDTANWEDVETPG